MARIATAALTEEERDALNNSGTSQEERHRLYAQDLRHTGECYAVAADAPGLRKDAARYLYQESMRLINEANIYQDRLEALLVLRP
jgi:hypothetical protein